MVDGIFHKTQFVTNRIGQNRLHAEGYPVLDVLQASAIGLHSGPTSKVGVAGRWAKPTSADLSLNRIGIDVIAKVWIQSITQIFRIAGRLAGTVVAGDDYQQGSIVIRQVGVKALYERIEETQGLSFPGPLFLICCQLLECTLHGLDGINHTLMFVILQAGGHG